MKEVNLQEVVKFVVDSHMGQVRKDSNIPYVTHCFQVAKFVFDATLDEELYVAALCHDIIEDCPNVDINELKKLIGEKAYNIVDELTCYPNQDKNEYMKSFEYKSAESYIIKVIDRLVNVKDFIVSGNKAYARKYLLKAESLIKGEWINTDKAERINNIMDSYYYYPIDTLIISIELDLDVDIDSFFII